MSARRSGRELIFLIGIASLLGCLVFAPPFDTVREGYGYGLRVTARITFAFFVLAYIARPMVVLLRKGQWLVRHRRYLGIMAALSHTVHFGYVLLYFTATGEALEVTTIVFGGLGFVFFWLMALTSNDVSQRTLGVWWKRLHRAGMHYNWVIFAQTYLFSPWGIALTLLAGGLRLAAWIKQRRTRRSCTS